MKKIMLLLHLLSLLDPSRCRFGYWLKVPGEHSAPTTQIYKTESLSWVAMMYRELCLVIVSRVTEYLPLDFLVSL